MLCTGSLDALRGAPDIRLALRALAGLDIALMRNSESIENDPDASPVQDPGRRFAVVDYEAWASKLGALSREVGVKRF